MTHFSIWIVSPAGYQHSRCFEEAALALRDAFAVLGFEAPIVTDPGEIRDRAVVLGANLLSSAQTLPPGLILYNLEQIQRDSPWLTPGYLELLRRYPVWDYSARNIERLKDYGIERVALCGIGYMPALTRIPAAIEDVDVVFVGSLNDRRRHVLDALAREGKSVRAGFNLYGGERDALIARAKLVLNLHFYESQVFEIVRVSYLLANRKCVVSETGHDSTLEGPLRDGVAFAPYDDLAETCLRLLEQPRERARLAARGFADFSALSQVPMLQRALASTRPAD
jgi:hypothetical protein